MSLSTQDIEFLSGLVAEQSGNVVSHRQAYLLEQRLTPLAKENGKADIHELVEDVKRSKNRILSQKIAEAVTVNETSFFRDGHPFEALRKSIIPEMIAARQTKKSLNIWCAACSSGQEPYSIAMTIREHFSELNDWKIRILATDISEEMLTKSRNGVFSQLEVNRGLPARKLVKFFDRQGTSWIAKPDIRSLIDCRSLNLSKPWPYLGEFDIVFIRNVLIYFDQSAKQDILCRAAKILKPDGFLFLGSSETTIGINVPLERKQKDDTVCYQNR
jgi:chemotaxis protein methyltransferase CheR